MWQDYINTVARGYYFKPPALKSEMNEIEKELQVALPDDLLGLYHETNGLSVDLVD